MASILKIICGSNYGIDQNDIKDLHLIELYAYDNEKIKDVNHKWRQF